jgi:NADP-dependent 3-hydroxy acid dehydrogenase YdfG
LSQAQDEIAIVTVGASGIGAACSQTPARDGAQAIVTDFDDAGGHVLMDKVKLRGGEAMFLPIDLHEVAKLGVPLGSAVQAQGIANGVPILASAASSDITGTDVHL